jgi:hypothetical protein
MTRCSLQNVGASCGFEKQQSQKHDDARRQAKCMAHEFVGVTKRRIRENRFDAVRGLLLFQKVDATRNVEGPVVVGDVGCNHLMPDAIAPRPAAHSQIGPESFSTSL